MSGHRFFIDLKIISADKTVEITGQDATHISRVLRLKPQDKLVLCDGQGRELDAVIAEVKKGSVVCSILKETRIPRTSRVLSVFQAVPKAKKMDLIVEKLTEIGVDEIIPVVMKRSVPDFKRGQEASRLIRWRKLAIEASKQSHRAYLPIVSDITAWHDALDRMAGQDAVIVPWESESKTGIGEVEIRDADKVGLVIGPEGGFDDSEISDLKALGAKTVSLGRNILRTETAAVVASALVMHQMGLL
jgi:16S rRNA (uracil1498-N3)-methyltransferase